MERILKALILLSLGVFLYSRLAGDTVLFYINERFVVLTLLAAVGLLVVSASYFFLAGTSGRGTSEEDHQDHAHDHPEADQGHVHSHGNASTIGLLILSIPIIVGFLVPARPLGADALGNREVEVGRLSSIAPPRSNDVTMGTLQGERNIVDWLHAFQSEPDLETFRGESADVIGFVYRDARFGPEQFMVGRFIVSCCVADASPVGLVVSYPQAEELPTDQWLEVRGQFTVEEFDGEMLPVLVADEIVLMEPPPQPYLYP